MGWRPGGGQLTAAQQAHLRITPPEELPITVDDLRLAQLVALWLDTGTLHRVLGTGSARVVLVLGDFSLKYQEVWGAVRDALQHHDYVPVWCDRLAAECQDAADLLSRLALLARFVLVDLSHAASPLQGLRALMPTLQRTRTLPVQPLWQETSITATTAGLGQEMPEETSSWLLEGRPYASPEHLRAILDQEVIAAAAAKVKALE